MATHEARLALATSIVEGTWAPEYAEDLALTDAECNEVRAWAIYEMRWRAARLGQKRALPLLRSYLTREQRRDLRRTRLFTITGSAGGVYRLCPHTGKVEGSHLRLGKRTYCTKVYCYHDPEAILPAADVTMGQMLLILTDEPAFLAEANVSTPGWLPYRIREQIGWPPREWFVCSIREGAAA